MATQLLHTDLESRHYDFQVDLDGSTYVVELRWNARAGSWFMSLYDHDRDPIAIGRKVVLAAPLQGRSPDPRLPAGVFLAIDTSRQDLDAGEDDLGRRVLLVHAQA